MLVAVNDPSNFRLMGLVHVINSKLLLALLVQELIQSIVVVTSVPDLLVPMNDGVLGPLSGIFDLSQGFLDALVDRVKL